MNYVQKIAKLISGTLIEIYSKYQLFFRDYYFPIKLNIKRLRECVF
jgi:hypothetical protein